jgi:hypothetical protein
MVLSLARVAVLGGVVAGLAACGPGRSQVSFVSNERPSGNGASQPTTAPSNPNGTTELGEDELVEPEHPAADTKPERALVHIHAGKEVCSGVVLGPRLVATAQRCLKGASHGASPVPADREIRIEVASSTLTWTNRRAKLTVLPQCDETELDVAILVLDEPAPVLAVPLSIVSAPNTGSHVEALGFGRCADAKKDMLERTGAVRSRDGRSLVIDVPLCKGDVGGPVVDGREGAVVGLISHRDDPEGSPLKTTTIARLDSTPARNLLAQAKLLAEGAAVAKSTPVACR